MDLDLSINLYKNKYEIFFYRCIHYHYKNLYKYIFIKLSRNICIFLSFSKIIWYFRENGINYNHVHVNW